MVGLLVAFQEDLEEQVPQMIEDILDLDQPIPESFEMLVSILAITIIVYGVAAAKDMVISKFTDRTVDHKIDALIGQLSKLTGKPKTEIIETISQQYEKPKRLKQLANNAVHFFKPSKSQSNAPIAVNDHDFDRKFVSVVPDSFLVEDANDDERLKQYENVELEIHAQDKDKEHTGWAAIPIGVHTKRLKMRLFEDIDTDDLWGKDQVIGDIILKLKRVGTEFVPSEIHLTRIRD